MLRQMPRRRPRVKRPPDAAARRPRAAGLASVALIVAVGLFAYAGSFRGLFVLDEQTAIVDNPNIRSLATAFSAPPNVGFAGRPVVSLSFALNYALAPAEARDAFTPPPVGYPREAWDLLYRNLWGYHAANLAIHVLAALTLFGIVRRTLGGDRLRPTTGSAAAPLALIVSLIWVAHPLNTASVTYVAQRVESLMGLFFLVTLYCAIRAGEPGPGRAPETGPSRVGLWWSVAAVAACALGAGTKEVTFSAPFVVVLYDLVFFSHGDGGVRPLWRRRWPLYAGLAASWVLLAILVASATRSASVGLYLQGWSPLTYLQTQAGVIVHYVRLVVVPWPLVLDYDWPAARSLVEVLPQALALATLFGLTVWGLLRRRPAGFLGAWFFLILGPSSSVLPIVTEIAAEHRMYLPSIAVIVAIVVGAWVAGRRWLAPRRAGIGLPAAVGLMVAAGAIAGCALLTRTRNLDYHSEERIWADTVAKRPNNARALSNLGVALVGLGRPAEAEPLLRRALAIRPDYPEAQSALGAVLAGGGRVDDALPLFARAVALEPRYADAWANYAEALATKGRLKEAAAAFRRAIELEPGNPRTLATAAWILATAGDDGVRDGAAALDYAQRAVGLTGGRDANALDNLAAALAETGRYREAADTAARAASAARGAGMHDLARDIEARRRVYQSGRPYREGPGAG